MLSLPGGKPIPLLLSGSQPGLYWFSLSEDSWDFATGVGTQEFICVMVGCGNREHKRTLTLCPLIGKRKANFSRSSQLLKFQLKAVMGAQGGSVP